MEYAWGVCVPGEWEGGVKVGVGGDDERVRPLEKRKGR